MSRWRKWRRRLLKSVAGFVVAIGLLYLVLWALMWHWVPDPPSLAQEPAITRLTPERRGDRVYLGRRGWRPGNVRHIEPIVAAVARPIPIPHDLGTRQRNTTH